MDTSNKNAIKRHMQELQENIMIPMSLVTAANVIWLPESEGPVLNDDQRDTILREPSKKEMTKMALDIICTTNNEAYLWLLDWLKEQQMKALATKIDTMAKAGSKSVATATGATAATHSRPAKLVKNNQARSDDAPAPVDTEKIIGNYPSKSKIIKTSTYLALLSEARNSVFRISIPQDKYIEVGTACLVTLEDVDPSGEQLHGFMTNSHVVTPEYVFGQKSIEIHFENAEDMKYSLKKARYVFMSSQFCLDVTFVQFDRSTVDRLKMAGLKFVPVQLEEPVRSGKIIICQHDQGSHTLNTSPGNMDPSDQASQGTFRGDASAIFHDADTMGGSSGSPVWSANTLTILGIHRGALDSTDNSMDLNMCVHMAFILKAIRLDRRQLSDNVHNIYRRPKPLRFAELDLLRQIGLIWEPNTYYTFCDVFIPVDHTVNITVLRTHHGWYWAPDTWHNALNHWLPITTDVQVYGSRQRASVTCPKTAHIIERLQDEDTSELLLSNSAEEVRLDA